MNEIAQEPRRTFLGRMALAALGLHGAASAAEQHYPTRPIKLYVSSPPGSTFDAIVRSASVDAEKLLGQPLVIENRSGAGGVPAFVAAKNSAPDGYTLVVLSLSTIRQPLQAEVGYSGINDFTWIASLAEISFGIVVPATSPFKTWKELLSWAKENPKKVAYGCPSGLGNSAHLFGSEIAAREKTEWLPVPYRASNDCMLALLGGELTFAIDTLISAAPQVRNGKVRMLALVTPERSKMWPEVPTTRELGYDMLIESPVGIGGPAGMDPKQVALLQDAYKHATEQPAFNALLEQGGMRPWYMSAVEFRAFAVRAEREQKALLTKYGYARN